ncbi:MAG: hypothetical protein ABI672_07035 [Vicinamibacteria bacterium]
MAIVPVALLFWNVQARTRGADFRALSGDWMRAWDDVAIAAGFAAYRDFPVAPYLATNSFSRKGQAAYTNFQDTFDGLERSYGTSLSRPWQGFPSSELFPRRPRVAQRFDDLGRAYLLGWGFRALGQTSPGLIFWIAPLLASLVMVWIVLESARAGRVVFGFCFCALVSVSAFCRDVLMLGYSAAGFYVVALLLASAYAAGVLNRRTSLRGLLLRSTAAGVCLAVTVNARSVSIVVVPVIVAAALRCVARLPRSVGQRAGGVVLTLALLLAPTSLLRSHLAAAAGDAVARFGGEHVPAFHDVWITYWQGLGDFDRTHGHVFLDQEGYAAVRAHGGGERLSEKSENIMKGLVIDSIRSEPSWYAGILAQRALATVTFRKIWPMASNGAPGFAPSTTSNEGAMDSYWGMTAQADTFAVGGTEVEIPAMVFPAVLGLFLAAAARRSSTLTSDRDPRGLLVLVGWLALACLPAPILTTTAGGFEPQAFGLVVFAATAGLLQMTVWKLCVRARNGRVAAPPPAAR